MVVWNRSPERCAALVAEGAVACATPAEVVERCSLTFAMVSDPAAALALAFGPDGVVGAMAAGKAYCDMSTVDAATSRRIGAAVEAAGGRFLEAPVLGSKQPAIDGQLVVLAAGDEGLFRGEAFAPLALMSKKALYLGAVGNGAVMKLCVNMTMGASLVAFAEGVALAGAAGLEAVDFVEAVDLSAISCPMYRAKGAAVASGGPFPAAFPLKHAQKDLRLALALGDDAGQPLPVAAAANAAFIAARARGDGDADFSAVAKVVRARPGGAGAA